MLFLFEMQIAEGGPLKTQHAQHRPQPPFDDGRAAVKEEGEWRGEGGRRRLLSVRGEEEEVVFGGEWAAEASLGRVFLAPCLHSTYGHYLVAAPTVTCTAYSAGVSSESRGMGGNHHFWGYVLPFEGRLYRQYVAYGKSFTI